MSSSEVSDYFKEMVIESTHLAAPKKLSQKKNIKLNFKK